MFSVFSISYHYINSIEERIPNVFGTIDITPSKLN